MKKKTFIVQLLDSKKPNRKSFTQVEDANFYSNDTDASLVFIPHEDSFEFQSAKVVMFNLSDESLVERDMVVTTENGRKVASYELPEEIILHWGEWVAQPVFVSGGEIYSGSIVPFSVFRYLMDNRPPTLRDVIKVDELYSQLVTVMDEISDKDVISAPEIILARGGENTLGERLDKEHNEVTAQLAQKVGGGTKAELEDLSAIALGEIFNEDRTRPVNLYSIPQNNSLKPRMFNPILQKYISLVFTWQIGTIDGSTGEPLAINTRIRTNDFVFLEKGTLIRLENKELYDYGINRYDVNDQSHISNSGWTDQDTPIQHTGYYRFAMRTKNDGVLSGVVQETGDNLLAFTKDSFFQSTPSRTHINDMWKQCTVLLGGSNYPILDNNSQKLIFPANNFDTIIYVGDVPYPNIIGRGGFEIDLSEATGTSALAILFDTVEQSFKIRPWNGLQGLRENHSIFGTLRKFNGKIDLNIPIPFIVDGKLYGISDSATVIENPMNANVKAVAHRGYSLEAPENTLPAFELAKKKGYSYVEVDIEWTSDNIPVCLHDGTIDRTSDGTGNIRDLTLEQVKSYDFGSWKSSQYTGTKIPTFEEFLVLCKKLNLHPYLESKGGITNEQAEILVNTVKKLGMVGRVTWICFSGTVLSSLLNFDNKARVGLLGSLSETLITNALNLKNESNEVFLDVSGGSITKELAEMALLNDMDLEVWTVNNEIEITDLISYGVTGITTDYLNVAEIMQQ